jgi:hypothetical protein
MMTKTGRIALTVTLGVIMACVGTIVVAQTSPAFEPVPESKIDQAQKGKAAQIATTTLNNWFKGQFAPLSDDFTSQMKEKLVPEAQKQATEGLKASLGDFQSMEFAEAVTTPSMQGIIVYRFKGRFSKATGSTEIRVVIDKQGKVGGLWVKPWQDKMQ